MCNARSPSAVWRIIERDGGRIVHSREALTAAKGPS